MSNETPEHLMHTMEQERSESRMIPAVPPITRPLYHLDQSLFAVPLEPPSAHDAGVECANQLTEPHLVARNIPEMYANLAVLESIARQRYDAQTDPAAFVAAFFRIVDNAISDTNHDAHENFPGLAEYQRQQQRAEGNDV